MRTRAFVVAVAIVLVSTGSAFTAPQFMPIEEIRPGMQGVGQTVFEGTTLEEFRAEIIGVLTNIVGPRRNLIIARLEGGPLETTGVIAGMSGSPVYIDGRLIGAVSYSLGSFSKEAIAGITPIAEMIEAAPLGARSHGQRVRVDMPATPESLAEAFRRALASSQPFAERAADLRATGGLPFGTHLGTMLRPIGIPLAMSGFRPEVVQLVSGTLLGNSGFVPMLGGSSMSATGEKTEVPLRPGDAVGVNLVGGDLSLGATGTVTHVDGDRVYAFGHAFYNLGPTAFPMTRAHVHTLLPSLLSSSKITTIGETIGTVSQDRSTGIAGTLGEGPPLIPIRLTLSSERGLRRDFSFQIVYDQLFTPLLTYVTLINTLSSYEREYGAATFSVKGKAVLKKHGEIAFEDVFAGESPSLGAAAAVAGPITFLLGNEFEPVEIELVELEISTSELPRTAAIERIWIDSVDPRPGRTVPLKVLVRTYRGEDVTYTVPVEIPANASGSLSLLVTDGSRLAQMEQRDTRQSFRTQGIAQMVRTVNRAPRNNRLYVRLMSAEAGAVVAGERMPALPPSVLAVLEGDRNGGNFTPLQSAAIGEWELRTDHALTGSRVLTFSVNRER
jgi:hypothetical protein